MRLFLDANLPPALARSLNALSEHDGHSVGHIHDLVVRGAADIVWIAAVAKEIDAAAVSGDNRMLTRKHELQALRENKLTTFILASGWSDLNFWNKAALLTRWWPKLIHLAEAESPGSIFRVPHRQTPIDLWPL